MSTKANYFKLGLFVIAGMATALGTLFLLGVGQNLRKPFLLETYLDQSVQGLEVGSKVKYRGVDAGVVHDISFSWERYEVGKPTALQKRYILIDVAVNEEIYRAQGKQAFLEDLRSEVMRGLRFRLNAQGITGLSYLELDYVAPERSPILPVTWIPENPYIPSAPGTLTKLLTAAEQVFRKLEEIDLEQVVTNLNRLLTTVDTEVRSAQIGHLSGEATNLLSELRVSNQALQGILKDPHWQELPTTAVATLNDVRSKIEKLDLDGVLQRIERTLAAAEGFLAGKEGDVATILANFRSLSENLRALSELARLHPSGVLLGAPPRTVQPPERSR